MNYEEKVNRLVGLVLLAEENYESIELIGDKDTIYDVALVLQNELGKDFFYECEEDDFEYLYANNDVLGIAITRDKEGVLYFLEEVFSGDVTLESDNDTFYILEDVIDSINTDRLHGDIVVLSELEDSNDEDYEKEIMEDVTEELDQVFEDIIADMIDELQEVDEDFCMHCVLKEALQRGYHEGYKSGLKMMKFAINDILDEME